MYFKLAIGNVRKSIRNYGIYFLTLVFGVCIFYAFNSITQQDTVLQMSEVQSQMVHLLSTLISGVSVFIAVILGFLIVYASRYLIRRRKKEFGTYLLLGMPAGKVSRVIVYETLFVGVISLCVGLIAGIALSQLLLYVTAALFTVEMDMFVFMFSWEAFVETILYFGVMFLVALIFNAVTVSRYRLINLINADRKNEDIKLRNVPLAIVLFIVALVIIGIAYTLLDENGLREFDDKFFASTVLVCVGTLLLFYSLSGFLLRAVQANKTLYLRGLNMFTLRQLSAKINTAFASITLVCMALFLAITASCGGFAMCTTFTQNLEKTTTYDASLRTFYNNEGPESELIGAWYPEAVADNFDMEVGLKQDIPNWDELVRTTTQIDFYMSDTSLKYVLDNTDVEINNSLYVGGNSDSNYLMLVPLSSLNAQREMLGMQPHELANDEFMIWCDFDELKNLYVDFLDKNTTLNVFGTTLTSSGAELETLLTETSSLAMNTGAIVVPDELIPENLPRYYSVLNVMYNGDRNAMEPLFIGALNDAYLEKWTNDPMLIGWPYGAELTAVQTNDQNVGLSVIIAYLAIYIGFVLLITCAAILALQQLSDAADNMVRYSLLEKLGVEKPMINKALFTQIGIYFIFPLIVALCHSFVALNVVVDVVSIYGHLDIAGPLAITLGIFFLVYGGYFVVTYFGSRTIIHQRIRA